MIAGAKQAKTVSYNLALVIVAFSELLSHERAKVVGEAHVHARHGKRIRDLATDAKFKAPALQQQSTDVRFLGEAQLIRSL